MIILLDRSAALYQAREVLTCGYILRSPKTAEGRAGAPHRSRLPKPGITRHLPGGGSARFSRPTAGAPPGGGSARFSPPTVGAPRGGGPQVRSRAVVVEHSMADSLFVSRGRRARI